MDDTPFWKRKSLSDLSLDEWESLCDGCGKCCLHKLEDLDNDEIYYTNIACALMDIGTCRCTNYVERTFRVPDCVELTATNLTDIKWLPPTCAYRLIDEGKDLAWWHPLVSGNPDTVHQAHVSAKDRAIPEKKAGGLEDHIVTWPEESHKEETL